MTPSMTRIKHLFLTLLLTTGGSLCPAEPNAVTDTIRPMVPDVLTDTLTTELSLGDTMPTTFNKKTPLHPPDMNTQHPIPEVVLECACNHGQPHVEYLTRDERGEIYTASLPPDFDIPFPPAIPALIIYREGTCQYVDREVEAAEKRVKAFQANVPPPVRECVETHGYIYAKYVTRDRRGEIYAVSPLMPKNRIPFPTGLPAYIIYRDGVCCMVDGREGLELHHSLVQRKQSRQR